MPAFLFAFHTQTSVWFFLSFFFKQFVLFHSYPVAKQVGRLFQALKRSLKERNDTLGTSMGETLKRVFSAALQVHILAFLLQALLSLHHVIIDGQ